MTLSMTLTFNKAGALSHAFSHAASCRINKLNVILIPLMLIKVVSTSINA